MKPAVGSRTEMSQQRTRELLNPTWSSADRIPDRPTCDVVFNPPHVLEESHDREFNQVLFLYQRLYKPIENQHSDLLRYFIYIFASGSVLCPFMAWFHRSSFQRSSTDEIRSLLLYDDGTQRGAVQMKEGSGQQEINSWPAAILTSVGRTQNRAGPIVL